MARGGRVIVLRPTSDRNGRAREPTMLPGWGFDQSAHGRDTGLDSYACSGGDETLRRPSRPLRRLAIHCSRPSPARRRTPFPSASRRPRSAIMRRASPQRLRAGGSREMLNVFTLVNGRLFQEEIESLEGLATVQRVGVDLEDPSPAEKSWITSRFGLTIPGDIVDDDLEESARFYEEDNGELHIRSDFLIDDPQTSRNVRVAFILRQNVLFSVHREDLPVFRLLRMRARRIPALIDDAKDVLLKLYDADAEYSADSLEGIYDNLDRVSARVLKEDIDDRAAA